MSDQSVKELTDRALQCIHLARTIRDRYKDPTQMTGEDSGKVQTLQKEASRLRNLASIESSQDQLEHWTGQPGELPDALAAQQSAAAKNGEIPADAFSEANRRRDVEMFAKAMRHGKEFTRGLDQAIKANLIEDATGEVIVPHDIAGPIFKTLPRLGIFRSSGPTVRPTSSNKVDLRSLTFATAGWGKIEVLGAAPPDPFGTASTPADVVEVHDLMGLSKIGVDELADTDANLVALIQDIIGQLFAQTEDDAFAAGNGTSKPWGIAARATSGLITQAVTAAGTSIITGDELKQLQYRVPSRFRGNGAYFASGDAAEKIALLKDSTSNYLWQPSIRAGEPDTLFGKRFFTMEGLPAATATTTITDPAVMFGDPSLGYLIADRQRITVQRLDERYAELGLVGFLFKMRVGGDVMRPAAFAKYLL